MTENFPKLMTDTEPQTQGSENTNVVNTKKRTPRYIIFKLQKTNGKILTEDVGFISKKKQG